MPFDTPEAESAPTRRSSRHRPAASATPVDEVTADEIRVPSADGNGSVPPSRRAARQRSTAPAAVQNVSESPAIDLSPVTARSRRAQRLNAESTPTTAVDEILADAVVIVSSQTAPVEVAVAVDVEPAPIVEDAPAAESPVSEPVAAQPVADEDLFTAASQIFRSQQSDAQDDPAPAESAAQTTVSDDDADAHVAPRKGRRPSARRIFAAGATVGVMGIAGLLAVSMTLPAEAVAAAQGVQATSAMSLVTSASGAADDRASDEEIQAFVASSDVANPNLQRNEEYSTVSLVDVAAEQGIHYSDTLYTNDPEASIQWPFVVGVAMSSGYGERRGRLHAGIDLVPGNGAPIQVIADGTVRIATESGGAYGVTVYVDHIIDGQVVTSHYAHMQFGSLRVKAGDKVKVGDIVGLVGNTGRSYGAHLHFEIIINGSTVNPLPWMQENAGRHEGVTPVS